MAVGPACTSVKALGATCGHQADGQNLRPELAPSDHLPHLGCLAGRRRAVEVIAVHVPHFLPICDGGVVCDGFITLLLFILCLC